MSNKYDYIIIGSGIAGCSVAHFLSNYFESVLLIDRNSEIGLGASGAAGAFLSPLLGKPNKFKDLVTKSLNFSTAFYKKNFPNEITNCGVVRIPKDEKDRNKFESYIPFMDFPFVEDGDGYFFEIGSQINSQRICEKLSENTKKLLNYEIDIIERVDNNWLINGEIEASNIILTTGADIDLINEGYFKIRAVWGQKIDILTTTKIDKNYHKACSISSSKYDNKSGKNIVSIGATHRRLDCNTDICNLCIKGTNLNKLLSHNYSLETSNEDTKELFEKAKDIMDLKDIELLGLKVGARASSIDYFPMVGKLIDSKRTLEKYPHLTNGSHIKNSMLISHENLFVLNGVGGRGFVLSPYLAKQLVDFIINGKEIDEEIKVDRLFKKWVRKL